jgi:ABC-type multidrug transport system ATPase subunit
MIHAVDVTHHYGVRPVLRGINLHVPKGDVLALMGPNGSGKSTLLAVLAGVLSPIKGHVSINGLRRRSTPENELAIRKQVVYLPADPFLPPLRTGREWVLAVGRVYDIEIDHLIDHAERLLDLFDLKEKADSPISSYSTGQQKKIALCCALATEAPVMLLDEPFSGGLDPSGIQALRKVLQSLAARDDVTIVFATPVPELVQELADQIAVIAGGKLLAVNKLDALRQQAGCSGGVAEVYEKLVKPDDGGHIERYFQGGGKS